MNFNVDILFNGFSGKLSVGYLGWGTWALIKNGKNNILLDTCFVGIRKYCPSILKKRNLKCEDIDYILVTHLHFDHIYNVDLFPNATIVLSKLEWEYANDSKNSDVFIERAAIPIIQERKKIFIEYDNQEVLEGITAILTPGHTPGSCSYILHQENGEKWVLAGDAAKNRGELTTEKVQLSTNMEDTIRSIKKIKLSGNRILPGHDSWIKIDSNGKVVAEEQNTVKLIFSQGITVNGGKSEIILKMD